MGLLVRLIFVAVAVLAVLAVLRAAVRRLWRVKHDLASPTRTRVLTKLDRSIIMVRRFAFGGLALFLILVAAHTATRYSWGSDQQGRTPQRSETP
jgi:hypothetical protein